MGDENEIHVVIKKPTKTKKDDSTTKVADVSTTTPTMTPTTTRTSAPLTTAMKKAKKDYTVILNIKVANASTAGPATNPNTTRSTGIGEQSIQSGVGKYDQKAPYADRIAADEKAARDVRETDERAARDTREADERAARDLREVDEAAVRKVASTLDEKKVHHFVHDSKEPTDETAEDDDVSEVADVSNVDRSTSVAVVGTDDKAEVDKNATAIREAEKAKGDNNATEVADVSNTTPTTAAPSTATNDKAEIDSKDKDTAKTKTEVDAEDVANDNSAGEKSTRTGQHAGPSDAAETRQQKFTTEKKHANLRKQSGAPNTAATQMHIRVVLHFVLGVFAVL